MSAIAARKRVFGILIAAGVGFLLLFARLLYVQIVWAKDLSKMALDMRMQDIPIQPRRGVIYDRNGRELSFSIDVESLYAIPAQVKDAEEAARALSPILNMKYEDILNRLTRKSSFEWIRRKLPDDVVRKIKELKLSGLGFTQESMRVWPKGTLLAQVLGIVGIDNDGLEGLEYEYDNVLKGIPGRFTCEVDAIGEALPQSQRGYVPPVQGKNLVLTVDEVIQFICERELDKQVRLSKAKGGIALAMDPRNGELLAMAMRPTYDPNRYDDYPTAARRITAITDSFPPGSTFKPITAAAALESGAINERDTFFCGGSTRVDGETLYCWDPAGHGSQSFQDVIVHSCNVGFTQIGLRVGIESFYKYMDLFGVTSTTGIDLPGEAEGIVPPKSQAKPIDLAVMSYGQTLQMTPIQIITTISAIANGGHMVVPHLVSEITDNNGNVIEKKSSAPVKQIISSKTSEELRYALEQVVAKGTGKAAYVPGYRLAGKTGTSNKVTNGRIEPGKYVSSFVGFAPSNDPRIALLVMIDEPQGAYYGGQVAAPVFSNIMRDTLRYLEVPPQEGPDVEKDKDAVMVPDLTGMDVVAAQKTLFEMGLSGIKEGPGVKVARQFPVKGAKVHKGVNVILYTEEEGVVSENQVRVPSLVGLGLSAVRTKLSEVGLSFNAQGSGFCVSQDPPAGSIVPKGTSVKVQFSMNER